MGRVTSLGSTQKRNGSYVSTIPSVAGGGVHVGTGNTSTTSDSTGNDGTQSHGTMGRYLKKSILKTILKAKNPRAADIEFSKNTDSTHVCPLSAQASTLMAMIHACDWALVREHIQTKKGALEFKHAVEYDEASQAMSLEVMGSETANGTSNASVTSEQIGSTSGKGMSSNMTGYVSPGVANQSNFAAVAKRKTDKPAKGMSGNMKGYVSPGVVSQSNFAAVKKTPHNTSSSGSTLCRDDSQGSLRSALDMGHGADHSVHGHGHGSSSGHSVSGARSTGSGASKSTKNGKIKTISSTPTILHLICTLYPPVQFLQRILSVKPAYSSTINNMEQTPLHLACAWGASPEVVQCLLKHNKKLANRLDHRGRTALHLLCEIGISKEQEDGDLSDLEDDEDTPIKQCMDFLTWAYPDATLVVDVENKTPLDYAVEAMAHPRMILQLQKIQKAQLEME